MRLAVAQNFDRGYLNVVIKGRTPAAEDIHLKIAEHFGMLCEEMLAFSRLILEGLVKAQEGEEQETTIIQCS